MTDRQTLQASPRTAAFSCQNTMVIRPHGRTRLKTKWLLNSISSTKSKQVLIPGSQFTQRGALPLARSTCEVCGWMKGPSVGRGSLEMKHVLGGCDCPTTVHLIPSSRVCNHEVNQHDTSTSITRAPFGVTCLLRESMEKKGGGVNPYLALLHNASYQGWVYQFSVHF